MLGTFNTQKASYKLAFLMCNNYPYKESVSWPHKPGSVLLRLKQTQQRQSFV